MTRPTPILPRALQPGDTIAIISPSAPSSEDRLAEGERLLSELGYRVKRMPHAAATGHYVAGDAHGRLADFHAAFADPEVSAILCARGGYGAMHLLPGIDWSVVRANPKIFIGFSDITVLLLTMAQQTGLVGFHGPMLTSNLIRGDEYSHQSLWATLTHSPQRDALVLAMPYDKTHYHCIQPGTASGPLLGGNLTLITALCGTPWQPNFEGAVLFIEDWHEAYYSIDRQWEQMAQAGIFRGVQGIALGEFVELDEDATLVQKYPLTELFRDLVKRTPDLGPTIPLGLGLPFGHGAQSATLPVGVPCRFESGSGRLEIEYAPVAMHHPASV